MGGYAKGIVELPGSKNDSQERVSRDRNEDVVGDAREDEGASTSSLSSPSSGAVDSSAVLIVGNGSVGIGSEPLSPGEDSELLPFAETKCEN